MAFPAVATTSTGSTVSGSSHVMTLPTGIQTGDIILALVSCTQHITGLPTGFTNLVTEWSGPPYGALCWRRATGSEGSSITFISDNGGLTAYTIYRISGAHFTTAPESAPVYTGYSGLANVRDHHDPSGWGIEDTLWIAVEVHNNIGTTSAPPTGWTNLLTAVTTGIGIGSARYTATAIDCGVVDYFTLAANYDWDTWTVAIRPAPPPPTISSVAEAFGWRVVANMNHGFGPSWGFGVSGTLLESYDIVAAPAFGWGIAAEVSKGQVGKTHHLKLGNEYLMIRSNSYQKKRAPTFGARITTGDPDYNNLSIWQHWVQKCWVGGMGSERWVDPEMFDSAVGVDTTSHEEMRLSRSLKRGAGSDWTLGGDANVSNHDFTVFNSRLYCLASRSFDALEGIGRPGITVDLIDAGHMVFDFSLIRGTIPIGLVDSATSRLYVYNPLDETWRSVALPGISFRVDCMTSFDGKLFLGGVDLGASALYYATIPGTWTKVDSPIGTSGSVTALRVFNQRLYASFDTQVWRLTSDLEWDGNTVFYTANANSGSNFISAMEPHLGYLYMLSQNGHLHRTDGNNTFDIWSWDGQTAGVSLKSYDNKLFVGTYEFTDTPDLGFGVLYQFTGAAVTELKRWGKVGKSTSIGKMTVYGRRLYYGASSLFGERDGFGVAMYDSVTDGHSIYAIQADPSYADTSGTGEAWLVDAVFVFGGKLFAAVRGHGVFFTQDSFKDAQMGLAQFVDTSVGGTLYSSLYDAGTPGLEKLWHKITVYCALPAGTSFIVSYSLDDGLNWLDFQQVYGPGPANEQFIFRMNNVRSTQFKWKIRLTTTDELKSPLVKGVVVAYLPQPEPNWLWTFTIPVSDKWQLMDGTEEVKDTEGLISYFETLFRNQEMVHFIDIDGVEWATVGPGVLIYDMSTVHFDIEDPREADLRVVLLETVESYA